MRENADQKNSEYGHFLRSAIFELFDFFGFIAIQKECWTTFNFLVTTFQLLSLMLNYSWLIFSSTL